MLDLSKFTNVNQTITLTNTRFVLNVQFHAALNTDYTAPFSIAESQALGIIARLNEVYNVHNIFFKYRGLNIIKDSSLQYSNFNGFVEMAAAIKEQFVIEGKYDDNAINFFLYQVLSGTVAGVNPEDNTDVFLGNFPPSTAGWQLYPNLIPKLLGHSLGLLNVESNTAGTLIIPIQPGCALTPAHNTDNELIKPTFDNINDTTIENVTRLSSSSSYNATTAGDLVADTAACFIDFQQNFCYASNNGFANLTDWNFNTFTVDQVGEPYNCSANEGNNFMSEKCVSGRNGLFTNGQVTRMKEFIEGNMDTIFRRKLNVNDDDTPDVSVLYEPFMSIMNNWGNSTMQATSRTFSTNPTHTGANVWNCGPFAMRFQTGFDCEFSSPTGTISQAIYQQYNTATSSYVGVKIPILGEEIYLNNAPVCFSSFEPFTSGDIKSLQYLGSPSYTQEELDRIKASDPNLYEELQSGKYHIITKETDSGYTDQKVIYKN